MAREQEPDWQPISALALIASLIDGQLESGKKGELHRGYREAMEDQLGALGLILNTITLWNTVYLETLRATGYPVSDEDVARLSPYVRKHINFHGHYAFRAPAPEPFAAHFATLTHPTTTEPALGGVCS